MRDGEAEPQHPEQPPAPAEPAPQTGEAIPAAQGEQPPPPAAPPVPVAPQKWVQCSACGKWRKVPHFVDVDGLPDTWACRVRIASAVDNLVCKCLCCLDQVALL